MMDFARSDLLDMDDDDDEADSGDQEDNTLLAHQAAALGNVPLLMEAVNIDPSVLESCDDKGLTPLSHSVLGKKLDMLKFLIKMGADINTQDALGRTPLCLAAYEGWYHGVVCLLRNGAKQTIADKSGRLPLHAATCDKDSRTLSALLQSLNVDDVDEPDNEGMTALHWAAFHKRPEHVQLLMLRGGDIYRTDVDEKTPLHWASQNGSLVCSSVMAKCLNGGAPLINSLEATGKTCVHLAAAAGHHEIILEFAQQPNVNFEALDPDERTPLHWAAVKGHPNCVKVLLELGVNSSPIDLDGGTPLQYSQQAGKDEVTKVLKEFERRAGRNFDDIGDARMVSSNSNHSPQGKSARDNAKRKRFGFFSNWLDRRKNNSKSRSGSLEKRQSASFDESLASTSRPGDVGGGAVAAADTNKSDMLSVGAQDNHSEGAVGFDRMSDDLWHSEDVQNTESYSQSMIKIRTSSTSSAVDGDSGNNDDALLHLHRRTDHDTQLGAEDVDGESGLHHARSEPHLGSSDSNSNALLDILSSDQHPSLHSTVDATNSTSAAHLKGKNDHVTKGMGQNKSRHSKLNSSASSSLLLKPFYRDLPNAAVLQQQAKEILEAQKGGGFPLPSAQPMKITSTSGRALSSLDGGLRPSSPKLAPILTKPKKTGEMSSSAGHPSAEPPGCSSAPACLGNTQGRSRSLTWETWENQWQGVTEVQFRPRPDVLEPIQHTLTEKSLKKKRKKKPQQKVISVSDKSGETSPGAGVSFSAASRQQEVISQ